MQPLWADVLSIAVGRKNKYMDLLAAAKESVIPGSVMSPNGLSIQPAAISQNTKNSPVLTLWNTALPIYL